MQTEKKMVLLSQKYGPKTTFPSKNNKIKVFSEKLNEKANQEKATPFIA